MFAALTGMGLAVSSGLSAYIPLIILGVLSRFTSVVDLPTAWTWLEEPWVLAVLAVLQTVEFVADKVPAVDHVNDVIQTLIRPTSGGIAFGATSTSDAVVVDSVGDLLDEWRWVPIAAGLGIALAVHIAKLVARYAINAATFGVGAPVVSTVEDVSAIVLAVTAVLAPVLVVVVIAAVIALFLRTLKGLRARRRLGAPTR